MKTLMRKMMIALIIVGGVAFSVHGETKSVVTPLSLGIVPPLQYPGEKSTVYGLSLGLFGACNHTVTGLQLSGLMNINSRSIYGIQIAGLINGGDGVGWQCAGLANIGNTVTGVQTALGLNMLGVDGGGSLSGIQIAGLVNAATVANGIQFSGGMNFVSNANGIQMTLALNFCDEEMNGVQLGLVNHAKKVNGVQFGLWNQTEDLCGVQIGLVNIAGSWGFPGLMIGW